MSRFVHLSPLLAGAFLLLNSANAQVLIDFQTAGQFADNFRKVSTATVDNAAQSTNLSPANNYVRYDRTTATTNSLVYLYDTTPLDTTEGTQSVFATSSTVTVSVGFRATTAGSSVGIYFGDPANGSNNLSAIFNLDSTLTTDQFRFFRDGALTGGAAGTLVGTAQTGSSGVDAGAINQATTPFSLLTATLTVSGTTPTLTLSVGTQSFSQVFNPGDFNFAGNNTTVMIRTFDNGAGAATPLDIDNFQIVPEPSPSLMLLVGLGLFSVVTRRRR